MNIKKRLLSISHKAPLFQRAGNGLALFLLVIGCTSPPHEQPPPPDILSEEAFFALTRELHLGEAIASQQRLLPYDSAAKLQAYLWASTLRKAGVSDSLYARSLNYYTAYPEQFIRIYDRLRDTLNMQLEPLRAGSP